MLVYAIEESTKNFVHVNDVQNGNKCGCVCPDCEDQLIAKNNCQDKRNHFAHQSLVEGRSCLMTQLHMAAQYYFLGIKTFKIPKVGFIHNGIYLSQAEKEVQVLSAELEAKVGKYFADVKLCTTVGDIHIEVFVTHECEDKKIDYYKQEALPSIEYDFSTLRDCEVEYCLGKLSANKIKAKWLYEWCREALVKQHLTEFTLAAEQELIRQKRSAKKSARKFINGKYGETISSSIVIDIFRNKGIR